MDILVVDDEEDASFITREMLQGAHRVLTACDSREALELLRVRAFDLLITDLCMPAVDGFSLIQQVHEIRPVLPVIVISAYYDDTDDIAVQMGKRHADVIFCKPVRKEVLLSAIERLCAPATLAAAHR